MKNMSKNNLEDLTNKLEDLAKYHAQELTHHKDNNGLIAEGYFDFKELSNTVLSLEFPNAFDKATVTQEIGNLETSVKELLNSSLVIQSKSSRKEIPIVFDALLEVFASTNEQFRQKYFHELIALYYKELCKNLQKLESETILDKVSYNVQVKILLPLVKLVLVAQGSQENLLTKDDKEQLISNIGRYFEFPRINQEDIYEVVRNKIDSNDFILKSYELRLLDEQNGHLGEYFKLKIIVDIKNKEHQLDLFAKYLTPKTESMRKMVSSGPSMKEEFFYMTYLPLLEEYGLKSLINFVPKCYFSRVNDVIVLDDMVANGFFGLAPNNHLNYDGLHIVIQKLANFHAATMILEEKLSQKEGRRVTIYDLYSEFLQEAFFINDDDYFFKPQFDNAVDIIHYIASKFPEVTKHFSKEFIEEKIDKGWRLHFEKLGKSDRFKNTMCHGDMYVSNMLFKSNEEKIYDDITLVDFQVLRYCPPTHDLMYLLQQSCTKDGRNKYLRQLCDEYYEELSKIIYDFGFNISTVYPKEDFENSLRYIRPQVLFQSLFFSPLFMLPPKVREEIFSSEEKSQEYMNTHPWKLIDLGLEDDVYKAVMKGLMEDLVELCENGDL